jgi:hypothetical protein
VTRILWIGAAALLLALAGLVSGSAPDRDPVAAFELMYFPSGRMLGTAALGFDGLASDVSFLRAIQYYGEHRLSDRQYPWAQHLFDVITDLDPRFVTPYIFGALVLAEDCRRLEAAVALLEKGALVAPDRWEYPFEAGFLTRVWSRDHARSAAYFTRAIALPGAPDYVRRFAAFAFMEGGSPGEALRLWREIESTCDEPGLREIARRYIERLEGRGNG